MIIYSIGIYRAMCRNESNRALLPTGIKTCRCSPLIPLDAAFYETLHGYPQYARPRTKSFYPAPK